MPEYVAHWIGGKTETLTGADAADALNKAGYGRGALRALDYIETVKPDADTLEEGGNA